MMIVLRESWRAEFHVDVAAESDELGEVEEGGEEGEACRGRRGAIGRWECRWLVRVRYVGRYLGWYGRQVRLEMRCGRQLS